MYPNPSNRQVRLGLVVALAVCALAGPTPVHAQWAVSEIGPSLFNHIMNQLNTYTARYQDSTEYLQQAQRWTQTYQHYRQQLVQVQGLFMSQGLSLDTAVAEVPDDWNVVKKCGAAFSLSSLTSALDLGGDDVVTKQREICGRIQVAQNRKFNATVRFIRDVSPKLDQHLKSIERRRDSSNDEGNVQAVSVDAQNFSNWMTAQFQSWDMQVRMYDGYVGSLQDAQRTLAEVALKGQKDRPIGNPVKTVILQGALAR